MASSLSALHSNCKQCIKCPFTGASRQRLAPLEAYLGMQFQLSGYGIPELAQARSLCIKAVGRTNVLQRLYILLNLDLGYC